MHKTLKLIISTWILFFLTAHAQTLSSKPIPITIGAIYNLSGPQNSLDLAAYQGAKLAVDTINAAGGVLGRPLQLEVVDGQTQENAIAEAAAKLAASDANVIMGLNDTDMAIAAIPIIAAHQKLFITSGATSPKLTSLAPHTVLYACFTDSDQASTAAEFAIANLRAKNAYVVTEKGMEYTHLLSNYFMQRYTQLGGNIINTSFFHEQPSIAIQLKKLQTTKISPDVIYAATSPQNAFTIIKQIRAAGFKQPIIGGDSFDTLSLITNSHPLNEVYFTTHAYLAKDNPAPRVITFITNYQKSFKQIPTTGFAALGYDTVNLIAKGIEESQSTDAIKIRDAIMHIQNYEGLSGTFNFSDDNPVPIKTVTIVKIDNNKKSFVATWHIKSRLK